MKIVTKVKAIIILVALLYLIPISLFVAEIIKQNLKIVMIMDKDMRSGGTGFHYKSTSGKTYILTNAHVCGTSKEVNVILDDKKEVKKVILVSDKADLCAIEATEEATLDSISSPTKLMPAIVVGYGSLNPASMKIGVLLSSMYVTMCKEATFMGCKVVEITLLDGYSFVIIGGHSGSPVINILGQLVGVANAGNGINSFAVPARDVLLFLKEVDNSVK